MRKALATVTVAVSLCLASSVSAKSLTVGFSQIGSESGWRAAETTVTKQQAEKRGVTL
ncbi:MAG TPA: sugar ABC transporter substrate-binding protein, partial [Agrobacterium sp.]|nr:sugar ABC transporter substrate-binding protein [Agrobacterium sp.]